MKWKCCAHNWPFVKGIHRSLVDFIHIRAVVRTTDVSIMLAQANTTNVMESYLNMNCPSMFESYTFKITTMSSRSLWVNHWTCSMNVGGAVVYLTTCPRQVKSCFRIWWVKISVIIEELCVKWIVTCTCSRLLSVWGKIMIAMYRLWLHGLYGLHGPRCMLSPKRLVNLITHSLNSLVQWIENSYFWEV